MPRRIRRVVTSPEVALWHLYTCEALCFAGRLRQRQSVAGQRLAALDQRHRGIGAVVMWVEANRAQFKGAVYGPLVCEVSIDHPLHASMLEQSVKGATSSHETLTLVVSSSRQAFVSVMWSLSGVLYVASLLLHQIGDELWMA